MSATFRPDDADYWAPLPFFAGVSAEAARHGLRIRHHPLGPLDDEEHTPVAAMLEMPPGYVLPRHSHACDRLEVIVRGTLEVGGEVLGPGTVLSSSADEMYGPHRAGPEGCVTVEIFAALEGVGRVRLDHGGSEEVRQYRH